MMARVILETNETSLSAMSNDRSFTDEYNLAYAMAKSIVAYDQLAKLDGHCKDFIKLVLSNIESMRVLAIIKDT